MSRLADEVYAETVANEIGSRVCPDCEAKDQRISELQELALRLIQDIRNRDKSISELEESCDVMSGILNNLVEIMPVYTAAELYECTKAMLAKIDELRAKLEAGIEIAEWWQGQTENPSEANDLADAVLTALKGQEDE